MENHHFQWVNPLFLWPFSIAMLNYHVYHCICIHRCVPLDHIGQFPCFSIDVSSLFIFQLFLFSFICVFILFPSLWFCAYIICMFFCMSLLLPKDDFPFQFPLFFPYTRVYIHILLYIHIYIYMYNYFHSSLTFPYSCRFFLLFPLFLKHLFPMSLLRSWDAQVPSVTASVVTLPEAFRPTAFRSALQGPDTWRCRSDVENPMGKPRSEAMIRNGKPRVNQHRYGKTHGFPWENGGCSKSMLVDRGVTRSWYWMMENGDDNNTQQATVMMIRIRMDWMGIRKIGIIRDMKSHMKNTLYTCWLI